jgi:two-component system, OmpR family, response regulator VanR
MKKKSNYNILFIEDEQALREVFCDILNKIYKKIYEASNGLEALEIFQNNKVDIVVTDINMPNMDGLAFLKELRKIDKNCKIIILTAHTNVDYLLDATELNITKYLIKPIDVEQLLEALEIAEEQTKNFEVLRKDIFEIKDGYVWNFSKKALFLNTNEIKLTKKEKLILNTIFSNPNKELNYKTLINTVWDKYDVEHKDTLKTMIASIRKKLPKDTIRTVYSIGYMYNN